MINTIFILLFISPFVGTGLYSIINYCRIDALLGIVISFIIGFVYIIMLDYINKNKKHSFINTVKGSFNKPVSFILLLILFIFILLTCIDKMFGIMDYISSQFLVKTPLLIIGIPYTLLNIYINFRGIKVIKKISKIFFIINSILLIVAIIGLIPNNTLSNLKPMFTNNIFDTIKGGLLVNCICLIPLFFTIDFNNNKLLPSYIISYAVIFMITFSMYSTMGIYLVSYFQQPGYIALQYFNFLNFINRVENIFNLQWLFGLFISISVYSYYLCSYFKQKIFKIIIPIVCLILPLFLYNDMLIFYKTIVTYIPYISLVILLIIFIIYVKIKIDHKRSI